MACKSFKNAYLFEKEFIKKYGKKRVSLAEAWIEGLNYSLRSLILKAEELLQLIRNMKSMTQSI